VAQNFTSPVAYTVTAEDGSTKTYTATVTVTPPATTKAITAFTLAGVSGLFDGFDIYVALPAGTDLTALTPTVSHTGVSISPVAGAQDFTSAVDYVVTAEDGSTATYRVHAAVAIDATDFGTFTGSGEHVSRATPDLADFQALYLVVGNEMRLVSPDNYTLSSGSTIITLKESYLKSLGNGTYHFAAVFTTGIAPIDLTVALPVAETTNSGTGAALPQAGDAGNMTAIAFAVFAALAGLGLLFVGCRMSRSRACARKH
jgi:LPXTG-motif cell wall-anchored protein